MPSNILKTAGIAAGILAIVTAIGAAGIAFWMHRFLSTPATPDSSQIVFTIAPGQGLSVIARNLAQKGLVTDSFRFELYARYKQAGTRLKAGEYQLARNETPDRILDLLVSGKVKLYRFTVPEGLNMEEIAGVVSEAGICSSREFLELCRAPGFIEELGLPDRAIQSIESLQSIQPLRSLEGYLFPDTYLYPKTATCRQIILTMTQGFNRVFTDEWRQRSADLGMSVHEVVTLASIIEKETGKAEERPLISSVFHNRLKRGMKLESDPTVIYGQEDYHGRIRYKHLRRITPYNTYQIRGLPIGPIASPGAQALHAALYPAHSNFLYFVSKNDTTHYFSKTLKEHNQAVRKYQLGH